MEMCKIAERILQKINICVKYVFENNDDKSRIVQLSTTVCQDCLNNMLDLIGNYLNSGGRIPWWDYEQTSGEKEEGQANNSKT